MLFIFGVHSFVLYLRYRYTGGWNTEAMISWLVPVFPAVSAWVYWAMNMRK
jgi:cytosine/uracil/thiamine/allantoin permease